MLDDLSDRLDISYWKIGVYIYLDTNTKMSKNGSIDLNNLMVEA